MNAGLMVDSKSAHHQAMHEPVGRTAGSLRAPGWEHPPGDVRLDRFQRGGLIALARPPGLETRIALAADTAIGWVYPGPLREWLVMPSRA